LEINFQIFLLFQKTLNKLTFREYQLFFDGALEPNFQIFDQLIFQRSHRRADLGEFILNFLGDLQILCLFENQIAHPFCFVGAFAGFRFGVDLGSAFQLHLFYQVVFDLSLDVRFETLVVVLLFRFF
jgi:hypothetical protein